MTLFVAQPKHRTIFPLLAGIGLAWTVAISPGYGSPALMSGVLLIVNWQLIGLLNNQPDATSQLFSKPALAVFAALSVAFWHARLSFPYLDRAANELNFDAGEVMHGAAGLRTNGLTYAMLEDLRKLTDNFQGHHRSYAILTDYSAAWVLSPQRNPLDCEWPQNNELRGHQLASRFIRQMCSLPADTPIIVQRHLLSSASDRLIPISAAREFYWLQIWLSERGKLIDRTPYFDLYFAPRWHEKSLPVTKS